MASGFSISMLVRTAAFTGFVKYCEHAVDDATKSALKQVSAMIIEIEHGIVPVLSGRLRGSISGGPINETGPHSFGMIVGPRGDPVFRYSGKAETRTGFREQAGGAAATAFPEAFEAEQAAAFKAGGA